MAKKIDAWETKHGELVRSKEQAEYCDLVFDEARARDEFARAKQSLLDVLDETVGTIGTAMVSAAEVYTATYHRYRDAVQARIKFELSGVPNKMRLFTPDYDNFGTPIPKTRSRYDPAEPRYDRDG